MSVARFEGTNRRGSACDLQGSACTRTYCLLSPCCLEMPAYEVIHESLEKILMEWFGQMRARSALLSDKLVVEKD